MGSCAQFWTTFVKMSEWALVSSTEQSHGSRHSGCPRLGYRHGRTRESGFSSAEGHGVSERAHYDVKELVRDVPGALWICVERPRPRAHTCQCSESKQHVQVCGNKGPS